MARGRKKATNEIAGKLLETMTFLDVGYKKSGDLQANTTVFWGGWAYSFDGIIAAGSPTVQGFSFDGAVDTALFKEALARVGKEMELTISDQGAHFSSDIFEAMVPVVALDKLRPVQPDAMMAPFPLGVNFVAAMELAGKVIRDSAENVRDATIMTNGDTLLATNGLVLLQAWHGNSMPVGQLFPKSFATALKSVGRDPKGFGFSENTFTVYYEDGSFIRTQTYPISTYPQAEVFKLMEPLLGAPMAIPPTKGLFEAVEKVEPFADERYGLAWFTGGSVKTGPSDSPDWTAEVDVKDLPAGVGINAKSLLIFKDITKSIWLGDGADPTPRAVVFGDTFRAAVIGMALAAPEPVQEAPAPLAPNAPSWGTGQASETAPAPSGWGTAPVGASSTESPATSKPSETTAPAMAWDQPAQASAEVSPSSPLPDAASQTGWGMGTAQQSEPATSVQEQASSAMASPSSDFVIAKPETPAPPAEGQEPFMRGAPGWDNVRNAAGGEPSWAGGSGIDWSQVATSSED